MKRNEHRESVVIVRLTVAERDALFDAAEADGRSVSSWVRQLVSQHLAPTKRKR